MINSKLNVLSVLILLGQTSQMMSMKYALVDTITASTFDDSFQFMTNSDFDGNQDPTHGLVNYVDYVTAKEKGYYDTSKGIIYLGVDSHNTLNQTGRDSIRVHSRNSYNDSIVVIFDAPHLPSTAMGPNNNSSKKGCGIWPAFWLANPTLSNGTGVWPGDGEIDIVEYVNTDSHVSTTLHVDKFCDLNSGTDDHGSGERVNTWNWGTNSNPYTGSGIIAPSVPVGSRFNELETSDKGIFVTEWKKNEFIRTFYITPANVPPDLEAIFYPNEEVVTSEVDPDNWGEPYARFNLTLCQNQFKNQKIIINIDFCGDWAGGVFSQTCGVEFNCTDYVANNPGHFNETYWQINSIKVFQSVPSLAPQPIHGEEL